MHFRFSNKRQTCPFCMARRGWAPIMRMGERHTSSRHYGYCHACGQSHLPDKATIAEIMDSLEDQYGMIFEEDYDNEPSATIPWEGLPQGQDSHLVNYIYQVFGDIDPSKSHLWPLVGADLHGSTIWIYTNLDQEVVGAKTMPYDPETGKRVKPGISINLQQGPVDFPAIHGYFNGGLDDDYATAHLWQWMTRAKGFRSGVWGISTIPEGEPIYLVESEKSALLASLYWPDKFFCATGGATSLTAQKLRELSGHLVKIVMDNDQAGVKGAQKIGRMCEIYEIEHRYLDIAALAKSYKVRLSDGLDLGDIVIGILEKERQHA